MAEPRPKAAPVDKRRAILDAAVRVFARQGYHATRVADIADEAGVAYGLVYHYFRSKEAVMTELFTERWSLLLAASEELYGQDISGPREARRDRAVHHRLLPPRPRADEGDHRRGHPRRQLVRRHPPARDPPRLRRRRQDRLRRAGGDGLYRAEVDPDFVGMWFYGAIEQLLSGWVFGLIPTTDEEFGRAREMVVETLCLGLERRDDA